MIITRSLRACWRVSFLFRRRLRWHCSILGLRKKCWLLRWGRSSMSQRRTIRSSSTMMRYCQTVTLKVIDWMSRISFASARTKFSRRRSKISNARNSRNKSSRRIWLNFQQADWAARTCEKPVPRTSKSPKQPPLSTNPSSPSNPSSKTANPKPRSPPWMSVGSSEETRSYRSRRYRITDRLWLTRLLIYSRSTQGHA